MFQLKDAYHLNRRTVDIGLLEILMDATFGPYDAQPDFNEFGGEDPISFLGLDD